MKRNLPMSALITGLLAMPGLGTAPASATERAVTVQTFPAEMPAAVAAEIRRLARMQRMDAFGMQGLQRRMALRVQERLAGILEKRETGE